MALDKKQKKKIQNYLVYSAIAVFGVILMWLLFFRPKGVEVPVEGQNSQNTTVPSAAEIELPEEKQDYYDELDADIRYGDILTEDNPQALDLSKVTMVRSKNMSADSSFITANERLNKTFEAITQKPESPVVVPELPSVPAPVVSSEQDEMMKKQLELQEQFLKQQEQMLQQQIEKQNEAQGIGLPPTVEQTAVASEGQMRVSPVVSASDGRVSSLKRGFYSGEAPARKNTILATIYGKQVITNGQNVRLRLREPMQVGNTVIPIGTIVIGRSTIGVDRVFITISSIEHDGVITPIDLNIYDYDGQLGIFVPGSMEQEAAREIGSEIANSVGSSGSQVNAMYNSTPSAAQQIATDVSRGVIQGTARYIGQKIAQIKIVLQDSHKVYLCTSMR